MNMRKLLSTVLAVLCVLQAALPVAAQEPVTEPEILVEESVTAEAKSEAEPAEEELTGEAAASEEPAGEETTEDAVATETPQEETESAVTEEQPDDGAQEPELSETPDAWAADAVAFCVENGIVDGQNLRLNDYTTRAELAAMLMRLLAVEQQADLSGYTDVGPDDWYYETMSQAVAAGVLTGSGTHLKPTNRVSRQEAMVTLSRCFGTADGDTALLNSYTDCAGVEPWAAEAVAGLVQQGYVSGYGTQLRPKWAMTRQELIRLIYDLAGSVVKEQPDGGTALTGSVVYQGTSLSNVTIDGNLYLGGSESQRQLSNVQVTGAIVCYGGSVVMQNGTTAQQVVLSGAGVTLTTGGGAHVVVRGSGAQISGGGTVETTSDVTLASGTYDTVTVERGTVTVQSGAAVTEAVLSSAASAITGSGMVTHATLQNAEAKVETANTETTIAAGGSFQTMKIQATRPANDVEPGTQTIYTEVQFSGIAAEERPLLCDLTWYVDGVAQKRQWQVPISDGTKVTYAYWAVLGTAAVSERTVTLQVTCGQDARNLTQTVTQVNEKVDTINVEATVRYDTSLYRTDSLTGYIRSVPAGTEVIYYDYVGQYSAAIRLPDGTSGWVNWYSVSISSKNYVQTNDYQTATKENFVNEKNYSSKTEYLVWISLLKQRVNVFKGSQGNWDLVQSFTCSSGKNTTPTNGGVFAYSYRLNQWDFNGFYVKRPMIFNGGHAFHSLPYYYGGGLYDPSMQKTVSGGCIRMYDEDLNWLWDNLPYQSTVVVY